MSAACSLRDLQARFLAALYDGDDAAAAELVEGAGLEADARLRIYRNNSLLNHTGALRDSFPATLALVGEDFFESAAMRFRRAHPSASGNLQDFGADFPSFLETLPGAGALPYLGDVARLEWLRQAVALTPQSDPRSSVRRFASRHAVLTLWHYAMANGGERLSLPVEGENVVLWHRDGEVAMAAVDAADFSRIGAELPITPSVPTSQESP